MTKLLFFTVTNTEPYSSVHILSLCCVYIWPEVIVYWSCIQFRTLCGSRIRVTFARPRTRGRGQRGYDPNMRCYQCGERGHFSRDCPDTKYGYKRPPSR